MRFKEFLPNPVLLEFLNEHREIRPVNGVISEGFFRLAVLPVDAQHEEEH
jgi:hypothetical protein